MKGFHRRGDGTLDSKDIERKSAPPTRAACGSGPHIGDTFLKSIPLPSNAPDLLTIPD